MTENHTPGPWRDGQDGNLRVYGPDGQSEHSGLIAVVYKGRANARLIAAAPELLAALQAILPLAADMINTVNGERGEETPDGEASILLVAEAAIKKATGQ